MWRGPRISLRSIRATAAHSRDRGRPVQCLLHLRGDAFLSRGLLVFLAQERILQPIRNGGAAFGHLDRSFVGILLARNAGLVLPLIVGAVPADHAQRIAAGSEISMGTVPPLPRLRNAPDG